MGSVEVLDREAGPAAGIAQPEPGLTPQLALARAEALIPLLREGQEEADQRGHYSEAVHQKMLEGGLYRMVQPKMFGGYEFSWTDFLRVVHAIARGHPSSGWCYCLGSSHSHMLGSHWSEQAQRELFGNGDFRSPHRAVPAGVFKPVDGGYVVNGVWSYSSGIPWATHFCGGALLPDAEGRLRPANFFVSKDKVTVLPDWGGDSALGMQGSGSNSVKLEDVFVPDHHIAFGDVLFGQDFDWAKGTHGARLHGNPMYLGVAGGPFHLCFSAITSGAARAALDEYEAVIRERKAYGGSGGAKMVSDPDIHRHLGEVLTLIDCAEAIMFGAMEHWDMYLDRWARTGEGISTEDTMRMWAMGRQSSFMSCKAVEIMFSSGGVASANRGQRLQRYFRDVQMFRIHPSSQSWVQEARGQTHLGLPPAKFAART